MASLDRQIAFFDRWAAVWDACFSEREIPESDFFRVLNREFPDFSEPLAALEAGEQMPSAVVAAFPRYFHPFVGYYLKDTEAAAHDVETHFALNAPEMTPPVHDKTYRVHLILNMHITPEIAALLEDEKYLQQFRIGGSAAFYCRMASLTNLGIVIPLAFAACVDLNTVIPEGLELMVTNLSESLKLGRERDHLLSGPLPQPLTEFVDAINRGVSYVDYFRDKALQELDFRNQRGLFSYDPHSYQGAPNPSQLQ